MAVSGDTQVTEAARLNGSFAPAAKQRINEFLQSFHSFEPVLGLLYGDIAGDVAGKPSWSITAFGSPIVEDMVEMYASFGAVVRYQLDGTQVLVPQMAHINELDSGTLDFVQNRLVKQEG